MDGRQHMGIAGVSAGIACFGLQQAGMDIAPASVVAASVVAAAGGLAPDLDHPWSLASFAIPTTLLGYGGGFLALSAWQKRQPGPHIIDFTALDPSMHSAAWLAVWVGVLLLTLSVLAGRFFSHRGPVHSITFGLIASAVVALGLLVFGAPLWWAAAFAWGWASHLLADATTKMGLPSLLWPLGSPLLQTAAVAVSTDTMGTPAEQAMESAPSTTPPTSPLCPSCGSTMLLRTAGRGSRQGERFWGCSNFPKCRQTQPL